MHLAVVIVAAGKSERFGAELSKIFHKLSGKLLIDHTIRAFRAYDPEIPIYLVLNESDIPFFKAHSTEKDVELVTGGNLRSDSVSNALSHLSASMDFVMVHDGSRPLVTPSLINRIYSHAVEHGNAVPTIPVVDSIRHIGPSDSQAVDRSQYHIVQTPQCFKTETLKNAFGETNDKSFMDEASRMEDAGHFIHLTEGDPENIKVTFPKDLLLSSVILEYREGQERN